MKASGKISAKKSIEKALEAVSKLSLSQLPVPRKERAQESNFRHGLGAPG